MGINFVSYSMTHHTRQSAIGLPYIEEAEYGDKTYRVSRYTMSEIIATVYDVIKESGIQEGILFLDEVNCVSETLAPAMWLAVFADVGVMILAVLNATRALR